MAAMLGCLGTSEDGRGSEGLCHRGNPYLFISDMMCYDPYQCERTGSRLMTLWNDVSSGCKASRSTPTWFEAGLKLLKS